MQDFKMKISNDDNSAFYERTPRMMQNARIVIIGCGGSGSWIAKSLVIAGCENLFLIDDDIVENHTLNRTPYRIKDIGKKKAIALTDILLELRSDISIKTFVGKITENSDFLMIRNSSLLIDATDSFDFKMRYSNLINDGAIDEMDYLKVGYDGNMYDIDGSMEYIFDSGANQGYTIKSTTVMTTMMLASKVTQIAYQILSTGLDSRYVRVIGDIREELGITENDDGRYAIMTNNRAEVVDRIVAPESEEDDFEFEIVTVNRNAPVTTVAEQIEQLPEPEITVSEADAIQQERRDAVETTN